MLKGPSKYPIAIDMSDRSIYAAQLADGRRGMVVRGLFCRRIGNGNGDEPDRADELVSVFREIRKNKRFSGRRVIMHLPPQSMFRFPMRLQLNGEETVEEAILRKSKGYLSFPIEEAVIDYPSLLSPSDGDGESYRAMIIAVRRQEIEKYMRLLKQAGLVVEAVDYCLSSLIRLHKSLDSTSPNPIVLCNMGDTESMLATATDKSILAQRYVPWGVQLLLEKVRGGFGLKEETRKAEALLGKYGLLYEDRETWRKELEGTKDGTAESVSRAIYQIVSPHIEELVYELHKLISYVRSEEHQASFEGIYLYGQAAVVRYLDRCLERRLGMPTRVMDPTAGMVFSDESVLTDESQAGPFGLALGLAMRRLPWL